MFQEFLAKRPLLQCRGRPLLLIMDGHAMVHRAWHAISVRQHLTVSKTGEDVTAVYGFVNTFLKAIRDWSPTHCLITFDLPTPTFRHRIFEQYKAQRPETPQELRDQFQRVRQMMRAFKVPIVEFEGYEADDVIGTLCCLAEGKDIETLILTGDTDTLQLVSPLVRVALQGRVRDRKVYDERAVKERYGGLSPVQHIDFKAIKGDPSDNIPGVPSVGEKTAIKLLLEYGSIEELYQRIQEVTPPKLRETLLRHREQVFQYKKLTTIVKQLPLELDMETSRFAQFDRGEVVNLFRELEFFTIAENIPYLNTEIEEAKHSSQPKTLIQQDYQVVQDEGSIEKLVRELLQSESFTFDTETTNLDPLRAELVGIALSNKAGKAWYVPVGHREGQQLPLKKVLEALRPLLENQRLRKVFHNANYDLSILANYSITVVNLAFDTMVAAHILGKSPLDLKSLALGVLNEEMTPIKSLIGTGRMKLTMDQIPIEVVSPYACADADMTFRLWSKFAGDLDKEGFTRILKDVELPLVPVLVDMQRQGVKLNSARLHEMAGDLDQQLQILKKNVYDLAGHTFNLNSPQQLSVVLFDELNLKRTKRMKTGYSTDANALAILVKEHEVIGKILEYRQLAKLKSTYVDALPLMVNPCTGRLHTSYRQTGSSTGRVSSRDPNLQNIPVRSDLGKQVRKAFIAGDAPYRILLSADYSQIELRVLAQMSQDSSLLEAFRIGEDIHQATASMMFDVTRREVTSDMRRIAKILNFGVIYGLSAYGISQQTEFNPEEGKKFIDTYFAKYPGIKQYIDFIKEQVRNTGYVETLIGRRRYLPDIRSSNYNVRQAAERMAVNMPIQGTAADIMKVAMVKVYQRLEHAGMKTRMILQVHDELIFETIQEELEALKDIVLEEMPKALELSVPLKVDLKQGCSWGDFD